MLEPSDDGSRGSIQDNMVPNLGCKYSNLLLLSHSRRSVLCFMLLVAAIGDRERGKIEWKDRQQEINHRVAVAFIILRAPMYWVLSLDKVVLIRR